MADPPLKRSARELYGYLWSILPGRSLPRARFLILTQGRSGSQLLADLLGQHPHVACEGELLSRRWVPRLRSAPRYLRGRMKMNGAPVWGFRVKWLQLVEHQRLDAPAFLRRELSQGRRIIQARRRNPVHLALSYLIAEQRGRWFETASTATRQSRYLIDVRRLRKVLDRQTRWRLQEEAFLRVVTHEVVVYEDDLLLAARHQATADRLFASLGLRPIRVQARLARSGGDMASRIANYEDVKASLRDTDYAQYL